MTGDSVRAALSQLGDVLEHLRERLGDGPDPAAHPDRDAHALDIFQEILSVPPLGLPPGELFGLAMDRVSRLLAADRALLFVVDDTTGRLTPRSARGFRRDDLETVVLDPGEGLVGRVFAEKRVLTYDAAAEPAGRDPFVERFPMRQGIAVPVRTEGEVGGVLFAGRHDLGAPFTTTDVLLLLVIADRVGSSLVHQRLLERRGDHLAHLRELRGLVDANLPAREPREILARASDAACRLAGVRGALALAGSASGRIAVLAGAGLLASVGPERFRADDDLLVDGFAADGPLAIRDLQARRPGRPGAARGGRDPRRPAGADARARPRGRAPLPGGPGAAGLLAGGNGVRADAGGPHRGRARDGAADRREPPRGCRSRGGPGRRGAGRADPRAGRSRRRDSRASSTRSSRPCWAARSSCSPARRTIPCAKAWSSSRKPRGAAPICSSGCSGWRRPISAAGSRSCRLSRRRR